MPNMSGTCPLTQRQQIDDYFMDNRNRVIEIAAFLDRLERASAQDAADDFRLVAMRQALQALCDDSGDYIRRVQMIFSDLNCELLDELDQKSAFGAAKPR